MPTQPLLAQCVLATRHFPSALILYRLAYWMPRAQIRLGEYLWIAKSNSDWQIETGLTREQVKDGIAKLRELRLIDTQRALFQNRVTACIRLTHWSHMAPIDESHMAPIGRSHLAPIYIQGDTTRRYYKEKNGTVTSSGAAGAGDPAICSEEEKQMPPPPRPKKTAAEFLSERKLKKPKVDHANTVAGAQAVWRENAAEEGTYVPPFTMKQLGQFKNFIKACPSGNGVKVLEKVLTNWLPFVHECESKAGAFNLPSAPNIDFVLKYASIAVNFTEGPSVTEKQFIPKSQSAPKTEVQSYAPPVDMPASLDELMEIVGNGAGVPKK